MALHTYLVPIDQAQLIAAHMLANPAATPFDFVSYSVVSTNPVVNPHFSLGPVAAAAAIAPADTFIVTLADHSKQLPHHSLHLFLQAMGTWASLTPNVVIRYHTGSSQE